MNINNKNIRKQINKRFFEIVDELSSPEIFQIKSVQSLCTKIGFQRAAFYDASNGKRDIPLTTVEKFIKKFPFVNRNYIYESKSPKYLQPPPVKKAAVDTSAGSQMLRIRNHFKLSQREMGELVGLTQAHISQYENGVSNIPDKIKIKLHAKLKIAYKFLIENKGEMIDSGVAPEQMVHLNNVRHQVYHEEKKLINTFDHSFRSVNGSFNNVLNSFNDVNNSFNNLKDVKV